jgi:putative transposase
VIDQEHPTKGTAVTNKYQRTAFDTSPLAVPDRVSIAMAEIAEDMREGLLALAARG